MRILRIFFVILLIINSLPIYSQSARIWRENEPIFDSIVYHNTANYLNFELFDTQKQKIIITSNNFHVKADSGSIIQSNQPFKYVLFPSKAPFSILNIYHQGKLIQKISLKVRKVPLPKVYLTADMKNQKPLDLSKPIHPQSTLGIILQADSHYKLVCPRDANYRITTCYVAQIRAKRTIEAQQIIANLIDLKNFNLRSGDMIKIEILNVQQLICEITSLPLSTSFLLKIR